MEKQTPQAQKRPSVPIFDVISNFSSSSHQRGVCCKPQKLLSIITQKLSFTVCFLTKSFLCDFRISAFQESLRSHPTSMEVRNKMASSSSRFGFDGHAHQQPFRASTTPTLVLADEKRMTSRRTRATSSVNQSRPPRMPVAQLPFSIITPKGIKEEEIYFSGHSISTFPPTNVSSLRRS